MYFRIYNNMNIKVLTFIRPCYFAFLANWFHMIISFSHKPGQVSRCMALVPPVFRTGLWMACLNLTGQPLHKSRNWGSGMGQQPVLSYCIMWRDHVAWPCGVKCFCEARRASHCHSPQTTYSSKSTCCAISAQNPVMHIVVYAGRLTSQRSIVEIINW